MYYAIVAVFGASVLAFVGLLHLLWEMGVLQIVVGNLLTYVILGMAALLLVLPLVFFLLRFLVSLTWRVPAFVKRKLWEIPPKILPMLENMISGLLLKMEARIVEKLKEVPKDVAHAVTGGLRRGARGLKKASTMPAAAFRKGKKRLSRKPSSSPKA